MSLKGHQELVFVVGKQCVFCEVINFHYSSFCGFQCGIFEDSCFLVARLLDHTYELHHFII